MELLGPRAVMVARSCTLEARAPWSSLAQGQSWWPGLGMDEVYLGTGLSPVGLTGAAMASCVPALHSSVSLAATSSLTLTDVLVCKTEAMLLLPEKSDGRYIFVCFLKETGLTQPYRLLVCPLDVPLQ